MLTDERLAQIWNWINDLGPWNSETRRLRAFHILILSAEGYTYTQMEAQLGIDRAAICRYRKKRRVLLAHVAGWTNYTAHEPTPGHPRGQYGYFGFK